jgi:dolichol-phosphate mannosyltransferase
VGILIIIAEREPVKPRKVSLFGGGQITLGFYRSPRGAGRTNYSWPKMMNLAADAVTGFSVVPLRLAFGLALLVAAIAILIVAYAVSMWVVGKTVPGWTSTTLLICFFAGAQLLVLGIIGEYVGRLMKETKARPAYLVDTMIAGGRSYSVSLDFSHPKALPMRQTEISGHTSSKLAKAALEGEG